MFTAQGLHGGTTVDAAANFAEYFVSHQAEPLIQDLDEQVGDDAAYLCL